MALPATPGGPSADEAGRNASAGQEQQDTVIPNLAAYVTVNPSLQQLLQGTGLGALTTASLKRWVPIAVDRAIREIIQPVVERSVTIACITTKEIVTKDFAMESDEAKMRKAGQLMVANLAGSLALVTCREPLRASVSTHLRQLLTSNLGRTDKLGEQEQNVIEQCVQICATDNIELGCMLIEKAATEKAVRDVDEALSAAMNTRRKHREQTGQPFYDMSIFSNGNQRYPNALPDQLRPKPGGLRPEHFQLYDSFQRMARQSQGLGPTSGGSGVGLPSPELQAAGLTVVGRYTSCQTCWWPAFSTDLLTALAAKLDAAVTSLLGAAGARAAEIKLSMLPRESQIRQLLSAVKQIMPNASQKGGASRPLVASEQELVLGFSQGIFKRLYELNLSEPLRLEALVALLENINTYCPKLGKDMGTWATYAPTNTEPQKACKTAPLLAQSFFGTRPDVAARADSGGIISAEFSFFIRTAFMEQISLQTSR
jgi:CCR4-NOT transcription complex subunit 1